MSNSGALDVNRIIKQLGIDPSHDTLILVGPPLTPTLCEIHYQAERSAQIVYMSRQDFNRFCGGRQVLTHNNRLDDKQIAIPVTAGEVLAHYGDVVLIEKHY